MRATPSIQLPRFGFEDQPVNAKLDRHTFLRCEARLTGMSHVEPAFLNGPLIKTTMLLKPASEFRTRYSYVSSVRNTIHWDVSHGSRVSGRTFPNHVLERAFHGAFCKVAARASSVLLFLQSEQAAGKSLRVSKWIRGCPMTTATCANIAQIEAAIQESLVYLESAQKIQLHRANKRQLHIWLATLR